MSNNKTNRGLGKGLEALLPSDHAILFSVGPDDNKVVQLEIIHIVPNKDQPRTRFIDNTLHELSKSIESNGVLQPIIVTKNEQNKYSIVAGERRWRAAQLAGLKKIPAIIRTFDELQKLELGLIENIQREDLSPLDQAVAIKRLHEQFSQSYEQIAIKLGKAYTTVVNATRLLKLPTHIQATLHEGKITEGHARALLSLNDRSDLQDLLLTKIIDKKLSVREAEQSVLASKQDKNSKKVKQAKVAQYDPKVFENYFSTKVKINQGKHGGTIVIAYKNNEDLDRITRLINPK